MTEWASLGGETPIDRTGLRKPGLIRTRSDLALAEATNISEAFLKYLATKPSTRTAPFDYEWLLDLHAEMFGDVWAWAGRARSNELNLGAPPHQIVEQLSGLIGDLWSWSEFGHSIEEQAVWLHHRAVAVHPFENGNGRWARLLANIWLTLHDESIVAWPDALIGTESEVREEYLEAMRAADAQNYAPLTELHARFAEPS